VKNKFYNFLLVGVSLAVFASHVDAKTAHGTAKKTTVKVVAKQSKKTVAKAAKKPPLNLLSIPPLYRLKNRPQLVLIPKKLNLIQPILPF
jgi:hypothetical protein